MSDSKKTVTATDKDTSKKETKATTKPAVVKKVSTKAAEEADKKTKVAIDKYKDIPLGELYEDLNGTQVYKDILQARRDELLRAKSIIDSGKRKLAIAKTSENTVDIEFKYQKNRTFKNHYVPKGNFNVVGPTATPDQGVQPQRDRVLGRSQERTISDAQPSGYTSNTTIIFRNQPAQARQVNITSTLEQRQDRAVGQQEPQQMAQRPAPAPTPAPAGQPANPNAGQMMQRPAPAAQPAAAPAQPMPMPMPMPQQQPAMAPMMAQPQQVAPVQQVVQPQPQPQAQPVAATPARDPNAYKKHKL